MMMPRGDRDLSCLRSAGFTLLELSVVLIIVTLLLGSVLRGEKILDDTRVQRMGLDQAAIGSAIRVYVEQYHFLPGDDPRASSRWPGAVDGNGDGWLDPQSMEAQHAWAHLRLARLFQAPLSPQGLPQHAGGGAVRLVPDAVGQPGLSVCMDDVSSLEAAALDRRFDDGDAAMGRVRRWVVTTDETASVSRTTWPVTGESVTVCIAL
ncbi:MAG: prepilin-type N-terminal cleavage/methylation domain-containing protein [Magnetococcales bacterium]|nr:prepilin-type N-terminal cleavage/methylation domain-containing protein [Magnetococcales bacterium]MBF0415446.1 prepilin-type N-terminal cleavage/methylation domain-containing protein [Magnetococcales bacterium]